MLRCECASPDEALQSAIASTLRAVTKLGGAVELAAPGSLPNDGKVIADELVAPGSLPNDGKVIADERG